MRPLPNPGPTGMASAARALQYLERRQEIVANNLANATTDGFKAERVFARLMGRATAPTGLPAAATATDLSSGSLRATNEPLDVAIEQDGFLVVATANGERFTRGGTLHLDAERRLVDANGNPLLGTRGPIAVPRELDGALTIDAAGVVAVGGARLDVLRFERAAPGDLQHEGSSLFIPGASRAEVPLEARSIRQGFLEGSNVNAVGTMVEMIDVQRAHAAVERAVRVLDEIRGTASNQLGKPV